MSDLVSEYRAALPAFGALRDAAVAHVTALVRDAGVNTHHITGRVKRPSSLADKLRRKPGRYRTLDDVTDLVGVRVITYFASDVGAVSRLIEEAGGVDWANSSDKSRMHDPDRFGYMGVHHVVRAGADLGPLPFPGVRFELQIRSILQHAWAEIEHDLGYKNPEAVPREVRRRFYRLAGLLEMADEEFMAVNHLAATYAAALPGRVQNDPGGVHVDAQSMAYLLTHPPVQELDEAVADALNVTLLRGWPDPERPQRLASVLHLVGVHTVGMLVGELRRQRAEVVRFAGLLMPRLRDAWTPAGGARPGTGVVHYALLRACASPGLDAGEIVRALDLSGVLPTDQMAEAVQEAYAEAGGVA